MSHGTLNRAFIVGRLGKDPQIRYTPKGTAVAVFSLATNESYRDKDGKAVKSTNWHQIVAWNHLANICGEYLKKGALVCVEGSLKTRRWDDKQGQKHSVTEIQAENLQMLGHKTTKQEASDGSATEETPATETVPESEEDI